MHQNHEKLQQTTFLIFLKSLFWPYLLQASDWSISSQAGIKATNAFISYMTHIRDDGKAGAELGQAQFQLS